MITALQIVQLVTVTWVWHVTGDTCSTNAHLANFQRHYPLEHALPYAMVSKGREARLVLHCVYQQTFLW